MLLLSLRQGRSFPIYIAFIVFKMEVLFINFCVILKLFQSRLENETSVNKVIVLLLLCHSYCKSLLCHTVSNA